MRPPIRSITAALGSAVLLLTTLSPTADAVNAVDLQGFSHFCFAPDGFYDGPYQNSHNGYPVTEELLTIPVAQPSTQAPRFFPVTDPGLVVHPTAGGLAENNRLLFKALIFPADHTRDDANTGEIRFEAFQIRANNEEQFGDRYYIYVGPSKRVMDENCDGTFYDRDGNERPSSQMDWTPKYVYRGGELTRNTGGGGGGGGGNGGAGGSSLSS